LTSNGDLKSVHLESNHRFVVYFTTLNGSDYIVPIGRLIVENVEVDGNGQGTIATSAWAE
jgi:hypothetical protein